MRLKIQSKRDVFGATLAALVLCTGGCAHLNDPFRDSSRYIDDEMNTASAEGYRTPPEFVTLVLRDSAEDVVHHENGSVTHWPLWFEDPFEDKGNRLDPRVHRDALDSEFVWNWADYLHILYGPGRFLLNTVAIPASIIVRPPGMLMESDGRISRGICWYDHDARPSDSVNREPPDYNQIGGESEPVQTEPRPRPADPQPGVSDLEPAEPEEAGMSETAATTTAPQSD